MPYVPADTVLQISPDRVRLARTAVAPLLAAASLAGSAAVRARMPSEAAVTLIAAALLARMSVDQGLLANGVALVAVLGTPWVGAPLAAALAVAAAAVAFLRLDLPALAACVALATLHAARAVRPPADPKKPEEPKDDPAARPVADVIWQ